ncbi:MAG: response regulator [Pseudomonadota bacterium]
MTDSTTQPRILIVEDEFLISMTAEDELRDAGFDVVGVASTYEEAVRLAEEQRPDLVLMDIRLGSKRDGIDAAIEIRARFDLPSLLTTGNHDADSARRAGPADPVGWLHKPYSLPGLVEAVRHALKDQSATGPATVSQT